MVKNIIMMAAALISLLPINSIAVEKILYDFENKNDACWGVPEWCWEKTDYVCKTVEISHDVASHGSSSLKLAVDFPGQGWRGAIAECESPLDFVSYKTISCDFYLPKGAPYGIQAKLILTTKKDSEYKWIETANTIDLTPGKCVTLSASLKPDSKDWIFPLGTVVEGNVNDPKVGGAVIMNMTDDVKANVEKMTVRIESDKATYKGDVYIDNITVND